MAEEASVRTCLLSETQRHLCIRDVIDLVRPGLEQQRVHDTRHVTGDTTAAFGGRGMTRVMFEYRPIAVPRVALQAHLVGVIAELERRGVGRGIRAVWVVATS